LSLEVTSDDLEVIKPDDESPAKALIGNSPQTSSLTESPEESKTQPEPNRDLVVENAEEIEREADAILERLRLSTVSHETETIVAQPTPSSEESLTSGDQTRDLDESQRILQEILSQKSLLGSAVGKSDQPGEPTDGPSMESVVPPIQSAAQSQPPINLEYPVSPAEPEAQARRDDSEMLIVSRMEQKLESAKPKEPDPLPFPETPVSKGRAQRMDYQQLFDQLRDISKD